MKITIKTITPEIAKDMLAKNHGNRPINRHHVQTLVREMTLGRWKINGDTICINEDKLIDGQHRLNAVVESGVTIQTLVVDGLPSDVFDTKDVGKRRSAADTLSVRGEVNGKNIAAALAVVDRYMTGRMEQTVNYTNTEIEALLDKYPQIRRSVHLCHNTRKLVPRSIISACHYLFSQRDEIAADAFVNGVLHGKDLSEGEPGYVLRERLLQNSLAKAKLSPAYLCALIIKAWNYHRAGMPLRVLRYREEGKHPEVFPVVA